MDTSELFNNIEITPDDDKDLVFSGLIHQLEHTPLPASFIPCNVTRQFYYDDEMTQTVLILKIPGNAIRVEFPDQAVLPECLFMHWFAYNYETLQAFQFHIGEIAYGPWQSMGKLYYGSIPCCSGTFAEYNCDMICKFIVVMIENFRAGMCNLSINATRMRMDDYSPNGPLITQARNHMQWGFDTTNNIIEWLRKNKKYKLVGKIKIEVRRKYIPIIDARDAFLDQLNCINNRPRKKAQ